MLSKSTPSISKVDESLEFMIHLKNTRKTNHKAHNQVKSDYKKSARLKLQKRERNNVLKVKKIKYS